LLQINVSIPVGIEVPDRATSRLPPASAQRDANDYFAVRGQIITSEQVRELDAMEVFDEADVGDTEGVPAVRRLREVSE
jgi:hypothetical protein